MTQGSATLYASDNIWNANAQNYDWTFQATSYAELFMTSSTLGRTVQPLLFLAVVGGQSTSRFILSNAVGDTTTKGELSSCSAPSHVIYLRLSTCCSRQVIYWNLIAECLYLFSSCRTLQPASYPSWCYNSYSCVDSPTSQCQQPTKSHYILPASSEWRTVQLAQHRCQYKHQHVYIYRSRTVQHIQLHYCRY